MRCRDQWGKGVEAGLAALITGQAAINLAAVLGLPPLTGIPLPFVSYGGSSLVIALLAVGILLNLPRGRGRAEAAPASAPRPGPVCSPLPVPPRCRTAPPPPART